MRGPGRFGQGRVIPCPNLLSQHPEVELRLHAELDEVLVGQMPAVDHLAKLSYTRMVLEEAVRLYPPAWIFGRKAIAND